MAVGPRRLLAGGIGIGIGIGVRRSARRSIGSMRVAPVVGSTDPTGAIMTIGVSIGRSSLASSIAMETEGSAPRVGSVTIGPRAGFRGC